MIKIWKRHRIIAQTIVYACIKVKNKHGYYLTAGVDFTISEENKLDLQLSYVSYSKDALAAFVSIVKAF